MFEELVDRWIRPEIGFLAFWCYAWAEKALVDLPTFLVVATAILGLKEIAIPAIRTYFIKKRGE